MAINWSEPGLPLSGGVHVALLVATMIAFSSTPKFEEMPETVAVDVIDTNQPAEMAKGEKTAKEAKPDPKPRAERVAETNDIKPENADAKRDVPSPVSRPPSTEPEQKAQVPPPPKPPEQQKPEPKKEEKKEPPTPKQEDLEAVLKAVKDTAQKEKTDKKPEDKKTTATANKAISNHYDASLPMSLSEKDAIMSQLAKCWHPLDGAKNAKNLVVVIDAEFNADGSYIKENIANESLGRYNSDSFFRSAADAALRAVRECSPLKNLPAEKYETWKIMELHFDPKELF